MFRRDVVHRSSSSKEGSSELLSLVQNMVNACISKRVVEQKEFAECLKRSLTGVADPSETFLYYFSKKHSSDEDVLKNLLRAVEMCVDDSCLLLLCGFIHDLVSMGSIKARLARHRKLIKADATSALIRTLRCRLKEAISRKKSRTAKYGEEDTTLIEQCDDTVAALVLAVGAKDCRLSLKIRVGGVLQLLCSLMVSDHVNTLSMTMAQLLCRSVRSPRNAQLALRHRGFAKQLLVRISSLETKDPVESALLARCLEMLYYVAKTRKARVLLVGENVVCRMLPLLERHVYLTKEESCQHSSTTSTDVHAEICLISLAVLRLLSINKRAKEQLLSCDVLSVCQDVMVKIERNLCGSASASRLQGSLCSLCLCCLPKIRFPVTSTSFPFKFCLPKRASPGWRPSSKSLARHYPRTSRASVVEQSMEIYVEDSSDEDGIDEYDEVFSGVGEECGSVVEEVDDEAELFEEPSAILRIRNRFYGLCEVQS